MYNYLSTLRLHDGSGGRTLTVGPKRRVVFKNSIYDTHATSSAEANGLSKTAIKRALEPLAGYWSKPTEGDHVPGAKVQPGVSVMSMHEFKTKARRLLVDAGLLEPRAAAEEGD